MVFFNNALVLIIKTYIKEKLLMARRKKQSVLGALIYLLSLLIFMIILFIIRLILFTYDVITIYTSKYKEKSGNGFWKTYFDKGNYGEFKLYRKIIKCFGKANVFANVYLAGKNTDNTEIDVLALAPHGIYVFEMKNYRGYIYGNENDQHWTQVFNRRSKYKFYNPLRQNYAHTKAVEKYLNVLEKDLIPVIVFSNSSKLQKITLTSGKPLLHLKGVPRLIKQNFKRRSKVYTNAQLNEYKVLILAKSNMSEDVKKRHIADVEAHIAAL